MRKGLYALVALLFTSTLVAQEAFRKNDVYGELMGNGIWASINWERQLGDKPGLGLRAGVGSFSGDEVFRVSIPIGINYLFTLTPNKSFLDAGVGATWSGAAGLKTARQDAAAGGRDYSEHICSLVPSIGYRRHTRGHFMWRTSFTPIFNKYRSLPWIGLSVGKRI